MQREGAVPAPEKSGLPFRVAIRSRSFILLTISFGLLGILTGAIPPHLVPLLVDRGVDAMRASILASALGFSLIAGRIVMGYLLDRIFAPLLMIAIVGIAVVGLIMMLVGVNGPWVVVSISLIGFSIGADGDFMSYLVSRYIGLRAFTSVCGLVYSAFTFGASIGPVVMGYSANISGNYDLALRILIASTTVAILPFLFLGRYPDEVTRSNARPQAVPAPNPVSASG